MKTRPKPKKISFIKLTTNNKTESKLNNKKNKPKKSTTFFNNNTLFINSPKNNNISSSSKYNEKLLNKIKEFSLENQILNQVLVNNSKISSNQTNKSKSSKEIEKNDINDIKFNSLDNNTTKNSNIKKLRNRNENKFNTDRQINPFSNKNIMINSTTNNENILNKIYKINKSRTKTISKSKKKEIIDTNIKLSKNNIFKKNNEKRNISANRRVKVNKKFFSRKESNDEFNVINTEENENFDIHTSYNLTTKNSFNYYYPELQFFSAKNMLEKKWKNNKINYEIKEESECYNINSELEIKNKNNKKPEICFKKSKTNMNSKNKYLKPSYKNFNEIRSENLNELKIKKNIKRINRKENTLASLHKNRIIFSEINNKDALSFSEIKGLCSPDAYSFETRRNKNDKISEKNQYLILNKNKIFNNKRLNFHNVENENTKLMENPKNLNINQSRKNGGSFLTKKGIFYESKKKSDAINKFENINNNQEKISFLNSPNIKTSKINKKRIECSYDCASSRYNNFKFHRIRKQKGNSESKSNSKSKSKSRSKSQYNKLKSSYNYINKLIKIIFSIKANWGNSLKVGINNIKLIDKNNKNIPIKKSNFDLGKPYITKYNKGDIKKLTIEFEPNYVLKNIVILNGYNDIGTKYLLIENDRGKILWKGVIPKANLINAKSFYISLDGNIINKKRIEFSKTTYANKIENNNNNNINNLKHVNNNTLRNIQINESSDNLNKNYVLCDKIKIKLLDNYGNKDYIGLSGIQIYDNNNKLINIIQNKKDIKINEAIINLKEKKILYNLFNNKNDTINPKYMFLTTNLNAFINIEFKQVFKISKIIFYNYNNNIYKDCATKGIFIDFYINGKRQNILNKSLYLFKPPGEEKIDYGQILLYPFDESNYFISKIKENLSEIILYNTSNKIIFNDEYQYYCPYFPLGHILKIEMFSNYGNKNYIGIENMQIFDEENKEIILFPSFNKNKVRNNIINDISPRIYVMPEGTQIKYKKKPLILSKLYNFNDANNKSGENRIYFIFNQCIAISKIKIINYEKYLEIAAKHIKIFLDDNIIFEGDLKNIELNNIYFCDKKYFSNKTVKKEIFDKTNNLSNEFDIKLNEIKNDINKNIISERYIEYGGKNGSKILKLSE